MFKKILCLLTALLLLLTMVACDSGNDDVETEETTKKPEETTKAEVAADFDWTLSTDGTYYIVSGIGTITDKEVKIPAEYKGLPVKEIGASAFLDCKNITSITISSSITKIGDYAFAGCTGLMEIVIPETVTSVGCGIFNNCSDDLTVKVEADEVPSGWDKDWKAGTKATIVMGDSDNSSGGSSSSTGYSEGLLYGGNYELTVLGIGTCTDTDIVIPAEHNGMEVVAIAEEAFKNCTSVKSIKIPDSVTSIGYAAFTGCSSLESLTMPWVMEIKTGWSAATSGLLGYAFGGTEYTGGVKVVQNYDDGGTLGMREIDFYIPATLKSVTVIKDQMWSKSVGGYAFSNCTMLESVTLPNDDASIGDRMFYGCTSLKTVNIPTDSTMIGDYAFYNCTSLQSITIPDSIKTIYYGAFYGCTSLTGISIPSRIEKIWDSAFKGCTSLTGTITLPSTVTYVGNTAFDDCGYTHIYVNTSLTDIDIYWGSDWNGDIPFSR